MSVVPYEGIRKLIVGFNSRYVLLILVTFMLSFAVNGQRLLQQSPNSRGLDTMQLMEQFPAIRLVSKTLCEPAFQNRLKKYFSGKKRYRNDFQAFLPNFIPLYFYFSK